MLFLRVINEVEGKVDGERRREKCYAIKVKIKKSTDTLLIFKCAFLVVHFVSSSTCYGGKVLDISDLVV